MQYAATFFKQATWWQYYIYTLYGIEVLYNKITENIILYKLKVYAINQIVQLLDRQKSSTFNTTTSATFYAASSVHQFFADIVVATQLIYTTVNRRPHRPRASKPGYLTTHIGIINN